MAWPEMVWVLRHGESAGNVARDRAVADGAEVIDVAQRDMDVDLSERGEGQARAVGAWFAGEGAQQRPTRVVTSPYVRARRTTELVLETAGIDIPVCADERVREREFGVLDRLTGLGIRRRHPEQAELRARVGKFYHRPPSGESWCDVGLRVRSVLAMIRQDLEGERLLIVSHEVPILMIRYALEAMDEERVLALSRDEPLINCSLGRFDRSGSQPIRRLWNWEAPVVQAGEEVTTEPETPVAPR